MIGIFLISYSEMARPYIEGRDDPSYWANAVPGRAVVVYETGVDLKAKAQELEAKGANVIRLNESLGGIVFTLPEKTVEATRAFLDALLEDPQVSYAEPDFWATVHFTPNDPYYSSAYQWGVRDIGCPEAWDTTLGSTDVIIAVVDQGTDYNHEDLAAHYSNPVGYDFVDSDTDPSPGPNEFHGSWTSGIAAAVINNGVGMSGVSNSRLYALRALDQYGGTYTDIADAITWAANNNADVISMSIGGPSYSSYLAQACQYAWDMGCYLAASSGNDGTSSISYPAAYETVVAVGAINQAHTRPYWSNYGPQLELCAPGVSVLGCYPGDQYVYADGTSASCPFVSGAAALLKAWRPSLTNADIRALLDSSAVDLGSSGWDQYYGYGEVNVWNAMTYTGITEEETGFPLPTIAKLYPTVGSNFTLQLRVPGDRKVKVELYTASGSKVKTLWAGSIETGVRALKLSLDGVAPGAYLIRYEDGVSKKTFKVLKR